MTRINTNVSSLNAQKSLARSNMSLQQALTRLSTGLRINTGRDDPAGLIASEALRSDITATEVAISNSHRANQMIATADSAMGQVSSLLNDIRGLVSEGANTGAMSDDQIAANQLQIDSSLEALDRIAQTTTFQGRRLLDGSLDFVTDAGSIASITDLRIDQANLGATGSIAVDVDIAAAATQATITSSGFSAATPATATLTFLAGTEMTGYASAADFDINAVSLGTAEQGVVVTQADAGVGNPLSVVYDSVAGTLKINFDYAAGTTSTLVVAEINNNVAEFTATDNTAGAIVAGDAAITGTTDYDSVLITAATAGADFNNIATSIVTQNGLGAGNEFATFNSTQGTLVVTVDDTATITTAAFAAAINSLAEFSGAATSSGDTLFDPTVNDSNVVANTDTTGGALLLDDLVLELGGTDGNEVVSFETGASVNQMVAAINLISDSTSVSASQSSGTLTLNSTAYGQKGLVAINVISEGALGTFEAGLSSSRVNGTDIDATVNGLAAIGDGNRVSINTSTLDMSVTVSEGSSTNFDFNITGGGGLFQLGPDVVSNQQARLGIQSVNTAKLGGNTGQLFQLKSGGSFSLVNDINSAAKVVDEAINSVTTLRGRLGAFQKTTIDTNIATLEDTLENLAEAQSQIRDADFAAESAALTRSQILVQSGISVLSMANSNPQNVLALLR
ncbi:MAG: flagellin [Candidatus Nealsonbacteria bacterium]|nr:flagellin [Candidatus Nealsonbacteria bacterium]